MELCMDVCAIGPGLDLYPPYSDPALGATWGENRTRRGRMHCLKHVPLGPRTCVFYGSWDSTSHGGECVLYPYPLPLH